ncbi:hypothetical protein THRCLA_22795 [Thraustotheca clavata]|uniref:Transmembrane protein n=1 Tax=Thraustotheca clavata TaxID=74557 RepID=A0A1V9YT34_9STRA|nr:hypothetical protein THRCLA_22795 [Thraustotheca clavata]
MGAKSTKTNRVGPVEVAKDFQLVRNEIALTIAARQLQGPRVSSIFQSRYLKWNLKLLSLHMTIEGFILVFFGKKGIFSRQGPLYELRLLLHQCISLPLQCTRGYKLSNHVDSSLMTLFGIVLSLQALFIPPLIT